MAWPKGKPRPEGAGRRKGTPNKSTQNLMDICEKYNFNPFEALVEMATRSPDDYTRMKCSFEICQYLYPKRKALEHSGEINTNKFNSMTLEQLEALGKELFGKKK